MLRDSRGQVVGAVEFFGDLTAVVSLQNRLEQVKHFGKLFSANDQMQKLFSRLPQIASPSAMC